MAIDQVWQHDKFPGQGVPMVNVSLKGGNAAGGAAQDTGAKLLVSNLHFNVTQQDVKVGGGVEMYVAHSQPLTSCLPSQELFAMCGAVKKASVNFDQAGRSKGTAEVIFARRCAPDSCKGLMNPPRLTSQPTPPQSRRTNCAAALQRCHSRWHADAHRAGGICSGARRERPVIWPHPRRRACWWTRESGGCQPHSDPG